MAATQTLNCAYIPNIDPAELHDGILSVSEVTGVRVRRTVTREYLVQEQYGIGGDRVFLVAKNSDQGREDLAAGRAGISRIGEVYECRIPFVGEPSCTCAGGRVHGHCVHASGLSSVIEAGQLPDSHESGSDYPTSMYDEDYFEIPKEPAMNPSFIPEIRINAMLAVNAAWDECHAASVALEKAQAAHEAALERKQKALRQMAKDMNFATGTVNIVAMEDCNYAVTCTNGVWAICVAPTYRL
jgi:hypothetical protein